MFYCEPWIDISEAVQIKSISPVLNAPDPDFTGWKFFGLDSLASCALLTIRWKLVIEYRPTPAIFLYAYLCCPQNTPDFMPAQNSSKVIWYQTLLMTLSKLMVFEESESSFNESLSEADIIAFLRISMSTIIRTYVTWLDYMINNIDQCLSQRRI